MLDRGNGYFEAEYGIRDAALLYDNGDEIVEIAHTSGDEIYAYDRVHEKEIREWAHEYEFKMIIWLCH